MAVRRKGEGQARSGGGGGAMRGSAQQQQQHQHQKPNGRPSNSDSKGVEKKEEVPTFCGLPMKWVSLVALTFQTSWQVFVIKFARAGGGQYLNTSVVFIAEVFKTLISIALLAREQGSLVRALQTLKFQVTSNPLGTLRFCIPGLAYAIMNNLVFLSLDKLSSAVQQVTYQLKILTAAGLSGAMLGKTISHTQWLALILLVIGVWLVQWPRDHGVPSPETFSFDADALVGFIAVVSAAFFGGFAGVYMEMVLKQAGASLWLRNAQLGFFGAWMSLIGVYVQDRDRVLQGGFFQGFSWRTGGAVFVLASGGLLVAVVIKYADNILRQFSTALSLIITALASWLVLQEFEPDMLFVLGTLITIAATFIYNLGLPRWCCDLVGK